MVSTMSDDVQQVAGTPDSGKANLCKAKAAGSQSRLDRSQVKSAEWVADATGRSDVPHSSRELHGSITLDSDANIRSELGT